MREELYSNLYAMSNPKKKAQQSGKLGNFAGTVRVPGRTNYVYVRLSDNTVAECYNTRVPPITNLNVLVETNPAKKTELMVTDIILTMHPQGEFAGGVSIPAHHETHTWPQYDTVYVDIRQWLRFHPSADGFNLTIRSGWLKTSTGLVWYAGETVDLTSSKPATGARFSLVSLSDVGVLVITDGVTAASIYLLGQANIPAVPEGYTPICYVRLFAGQTSISDISSTNTDLIDIRLSSLGGDAGSAIWGNITGDVNNQRDIQDFVFDYLKFNTAYTGTYEEGSIYWNAEEKTFDVGLNDGVVGQMFLEGYFDYKNQTGSTISDGTPLMFAGSLGASAVALVQLAIADDSVRPEYIMGIATHECLNGELGKATWRGKVRHINTTGAPYGETWSDGDLIYVSPFIAGNLTNIEPIAPNRRILVASVLKAHSNGTLLLRPTWTPKLSELDDVDGAAASRTGDLVTWNDASGTYMQSDYNITDYYRKDESIEVPTGSAFYFGEESTEGTWRIIRTGNDLSIQRYESSVWVNKTIITA